MVVPCPEKLKMKKKMNRINEVLAEKGLTQKEFAKLVGVEQQTVSVWCSNKGQPTVERLFEIAAALNVAVADLIENATTPQ